MNICGKLASGHFLLIVICIFTMTINIVSGQQSSPETLISTTDATKTAIDTLLSLSKKLKDLELKLDQLHTKSSETKNIQDLQAQINNNKKIKKEAAITTITELHKLLGTSSRLINNTIATAKLFDSVADAMKILDEPEAVLIDNTSVKAEKLYRTSSDAIGIIGVASSIVTLTSNTNSNSNTTASIAILGGSVILRYLLKVISEKKSSKNTLNYIHDKATQLSIHAFLVLRIKSVSEYLSNLQTNNKNILSQIDGYQVKNDEGLVTSTTPGIDPSKGSVELRNIDKASEELLRLFIEVDNFYNNELAALQAEVKNRSGFTIYTEKGIKSLNNLDESISAARDSWRNIRYYYSNVETAILLFKKDYANIEEALKYN